MLLGGGCVAAQRGGSTFERSGRGESVTKHTVTVSCRAQICGQLAPPVACELLSVLPEQWNGNIVKCAPARREIAVSVAQWRYESLNLAYGIVAASGIARNESKLAGSALSDDGQVCVRVRVIAISDDPVWVQPTRSISGGCFSMLK